MRTVLEKFTLLASRKPRLAAIFFFPVSSVFVCLAKNGVPVKTQVSLQKGKFREKDANAIKMWSTCESYYQTDRVKRNFFSCTVNSQKYTFHFYFFYKFIP
jgi:hypothetical protein